MCVTDLPGDPDGVLVLHDVMELVDEAYEPGEGSTSANASPIVFDSDDEDLDVPPLRPRRSSRRNYSHRRRQRDERCSGGADSNEPSLGVTSLAAAPIFGSPAMLDFGVDDTDEDVTGGVYHGAVTAKLKQPMEQWRLKSTITDVNITPAVPVKQKTKQTKTKPVKEAKGTPKPRMNPKDEVQYLRERAKQLEQTLETLRLQALADKEKAMETAIVFNLVPQPELLAPLHNNSEPGSPAQTQTTKNRVGSPATVDCSQDSSVVSSDGLWERIATFQKAEYEKSMKHNKHLRVMAEQQLRALKQLEVAFRNPPATEGSLNIRLQERGWNVLRSLTSTASCVDPNRAMSFTQTCMLVSPLGRAEFSASYVAVGTLANVLVGCYHRTVIAMHQVLEKLLLVEDTRSLLD